MFFIGVALGCLIICILGVHFTTNLFYAMSQEIERDILQRINDIRSKEFKDKLKEEFDKECVSPDFGYAISEDLDTVDLPEFDEDILDETDMQWQENFDQTKSLDC